jgi:cell division septum initiation protein DivIVA
MIFETDPFEAHRRRKGRGGQVALWESDIPPPPDGEGVDGPESNFDTVRRGFAPDQVAGYLKRVATGVLILESRLEEARSELLEARRERDQALVALETSAGPDPHAAVSQRVNELIRSFDTQVGGLLRDAEEESGRVVSAARTDAGRILAQARAEADRIIAEARAGAERARQEIDRASRDLGAMRDTLLETFLDFRDRTVMALGEVEAVIEKEASSDHVVVVGDADEPGPPDVPQVPRPDP